MHFLSALVSREGLTLSNNGENVGNVPEASKVILM